jgi:phage terminase small subunit
MPASQDKNKPLTGKERGAALHYLRFGVKTDAYRAFYNCSRMKVRTVQRKAMELFAKPNVATFVEESRAATIKATEVRLERIVETLATIAFTDITEVVDWDGERLTVLELEDLTPAQRGAIKKVKRQKGYVEVEMHDKMVALRLLGTWLGMFAKRDVVEDVPPIQFQLFMDTPKKVDD